ncbi:hypothetical protein BACEGG_01941 [Bacteroides eggerthii DSM 20697]|nr:hypothetical protein BACEGG_01941 [Bacteroides eggerthii DSM 20697]
MAGCEWRFSDLEEKKIKGRRPFPWSFSLPFPGYGNLYSRYSFGALHCEYLFLR